MAANTSPDIIVDGTRLVTLCADVTVYWRGSMFERADGITAFYERAMALIGSSVRWYETETMDHVAAIDEHVFDMLPFWLTSQKAQRGIYALLLESGESEIDSSDRAFLLFYDQDEPPAMGALRLVLPAQHLVQSPEAFAKLVTDLTVGLDFESGHAGYSINWDPRGGAALEAEEHLRRIAARYLGIDIPEISTTLINMQAYGKPAIKCVNWITLLGSALAQQVGPAKVVQEALPKDCCVLDLHGRYLIQAGVEPSVGDKRKKERLPSYCAVGRLLASLRLLEHAPLFLDDDDATEAWLARFDD